MEQNLRKGSLLPMMALLKKNVTQALESVLGKKVAVVDEKAYAYYNLLSRKLDSLIQAVKDAPKIEMKGTPASINIQSMGQDTIARLTSQIAELKQVMKANKVVLPRIQSVEVTNHPSAPEFDTSPVVEAVKRLEETVRQLKLEAPTVAQQPINFPDFPKTMQFKEAKDILAALKDLKDGIDSLPKKFPTTEFPSTINVGNFPPQKTPMPVTNININPLRGFAKSRSVTVTSALTPLPGEVLSNRRGIVIYNNSNVSLYIGGSDVSSTNGMIVPASSYSPALDAGSRMIIYGIVATGSADVRVLEVSNEAYTGG